MAQMGCPVNKDTQSRRSRPKLLLLDLGVRMVVRGYVLGQTHEFLLKLGSSSGTLLHSTLSRSAGLEEYFFRCRRKVLSVGLRLPSFGFARKMSDSMVDERHRTAWLTGASGVASWARTTYALPCGPESVDLLHNPISQDNGIVNNGHHRWRWSRAI